MKTLFFLATVTLTLTQPAAAAGLAAKEALRTLGRERGPSWLDRVVQMSGDRGMDQPEAWHIVAADNRGVLREFFVSRKGIISEGVVPAAAVPALQGPVVVQKKFTFDSTMAFTKADNAAKRGRIGFDSATYRLRSPGAGLAPVWQLQLNNAANQKVGEITLSASSGRVHQFVGFNPPQPTSPAASSHTRQALAKTRDVVNRGAAGVGRGISHAGGWVRRTFTPAPPPPKYYVPPSSR